MQLIGLPAPDYALAADKLGPYFMIFESMSKGRWTADVLDEMVRDGRAQCYVAWDGDDACACALSEVVGYPTGVDWVRILAVAGEGRGEWPSLMEQFLEGAKRSGYAGVEMYARTGWARALKGRMGNMINVYEEVF